MKLCRIAKPKRDWAAQTIPEGLVGSTPVSLKLVSLFFEVFRALFI